MYTANYPLTETLVSGHLQLRTLFSISLFTLFSYGEYSRKRTFFPIPGECLLTRELTVFENPALIQRLLTRAFFSRFKVFFSDKLTNKIYLS